MYQKYLFKANKQKPIPTLLQEAADFLMLLGKDLYNVGLVLLRIGEGLFAAGLILSFFVH